MIYTNFFYGVAKESNKNFFTNSTFYNVYGLYKKKYKNLKKNWCYLINIKRSAFELNVNNLNKETVSVFSKKRINQVHDMNLINFTSIRKKQAILSNKFFNQCFDKGRIKNFVLWFLLNYGEYKTVQLVEQLKNIGFEYASKAGISLGIDDLKIPPKKANLIFEAENLTTNTVNQYVRGEITGVERFQRLIDTWHRTSEILKQEVIDYFEKTDILNPVYMMAFSGARGNISQVRQLVGMRGLMADPQGQIIDFPIRSNFREGLTLTEYIISSYGARKGIVDTALRTANAGYLTRRLVDVAQHVIISNYDCGTTRGIILTNMKEGNKIIHSISQRMVGRILARDLFITKTNTDLLRNNQQLQKNQIKIASRNEEVNLDLSFEIGKNFDKVFVRSPLTCEKMICQLCYGWSLAQGKLISIGEAVGVVAAQSIGEPGTQLTMRTFHTGGVFSGDVSDQIKAPFNGFIEYISAIPGTLIRTPEGKIAFLTKSEGSFFVKKLNAPISSLEENQLKKFTIPHYTLLYIRNGQNVYEKEVIAQISTISQKINATDDAELTIKSEIEGQFYSKILSFREKMIGFSLDKNKKTNKKVIKIDLICNNQLSKFNKFRKISHFIKPKNSLNNQTDFFNDLIFRQIDSEKIYEAWTWGYAWILSGKIYEYKNSCSFKTITPSLPILGDLLNTKSHMTQTKWGLNNMFIKNLSFSFNKRIPSENADLFLLQNQKNSINYNKNLDQVNQKTNSIQTLNSQKIFPIQTTPILLLDLNNIFYKKFGYTLEVAKKIQFVSSNSPNSFMEGQQLQTKKLKNDLIFFIKNQKSRALFSMLSNKELVSFTDLQLNKSKSLNQSSFNLNLLKNNKQNYFQKLPYILQWFPNKYKTELGGFTFFENNFFSTKPYFNWLWLTNSSLFFSNKFLLPLVDKPNNHYFAKEKKINAPCFLRSNTRKVFCQNIERLFFLNRFLLLKIVDNSNTTPPKFYHVPSDSYKFSVLKNRSLNKKIEKNKSFMSIFLNKKLNILKTNRQGSLYVSSLTEKEFINSNYSIQVLQRLFTASKTIKNIYNFSTDFKYNLNLKNNKKSIEIIENNKQMSAFMHNSKNNIGFAKLNQFLSEKSNNLSCLVNIKKSTILLNDLKKKSTQKNENEPLLSTQIKKLENNKFFSKIFLCLPSPVLREPLLCTQYVQKKQESKQNKKLNINLNQRYKTDHLNNIMSLYAKHAKEGEVTYFVNKIKFFKTLKLKNLKTFCTIFFNKNLDLIFYNSDQKVNKPLIHNANFIKKRALQANLNNLDTSFVSFNYYQNLISQIRYNLVKNIHFTSFLKQKFLYLPMLRNNQQKNAFKSKLTSSSKQSQKIFFSKKQNQYFENFNFKKQRVLIFLNSIYLTTKSFNVSNFLNTFYTKFNLIKNKLQFYSFIDMNSSINLLNLRLCSTFVTKKFVNFNSFFIFYPMQDFIKNNSINLFFPPYFLYKQNKDIKTIFKNKKNPSLLTVQLKQSQPDFSNIDLNDLTPDLSNYKKPVHIQDKLVFIKKEEYNYPSFANKKTGSKNLSLTHINILHPKRSIALNKRCKIDQNKKIEKVIYHAIVKKGWPFVSFISPFSFINFHKKLILSGQPVFNDIFFHTPVFTESFLLNNIFSIEDINSFSSIPYLDSYNTNSFYSSQILPFLNNKKYNHSSEAHGVNNVNFLNNLNINNLVNKNSISSINGMDNSPINGHENGNGNGNGYRHISAKGYRNIYENGNIHENGNGNGNLNGNGNGKIDMQINIKNIAKNRFHSLNDNAFLNSFVNTNQNKHNDINKNNNNQTNQNNNNNNNNDNNVNQNDKDNKYNETKYKDLLKNKSFEKLNDLNLIWIKNKKSRFYIPETKSSYFNLNKKENYKNIKKEKKNLKINYSKGFGILFQPVNEFEQMNLMELKKYTFESTINVYTNSFKHIFKIYKKNKNNKKFSFGISGIKKTTPTTICFINNLNSLLDLIIEKQKINHFDLLVKPFIKKIKVESTKHNKPSKNIRNVTNVANFARKTSNLSSHINKKFKLNKILVNQSFDSLLKLQQLKTQNYTSNILFKNKKDSFCSASITDQEIVKGKTNKKDFSNLITIIIFSFFYTINNDLIKKIHFINQLLFIEKSNYLKIVDRLEGSFSPVKTENEYNQVRDINFVNIVNKNLNNKYENILISFIFYFLKNKKKQHLATFISNVNQVGAQTSLDFIQIKLKKYFYGEAKEIKKNDFDFNQLFTRHFSLIQKNKESFLVKSNFIMFYKMALKKYVNSNIELKNISQLNSYVSKSLSYDGETNINWTNMKNSSVFYNKLLQTKKYLNFFSKNQLNFSTFYVLYDKDNLLNKSNFNLFNKQSLLPFVDNHIKENYNFSYTSISKFDSLLYPLLHSNISLILNFYLLNFLNKKHNINKARINQYKHALFSKKTNNLHITSIFNSLINNFFENPCFSFNLYELIDLSVFKKTKTQKTFFLYYNFFNQYDKSLLYQQPNIQQISAKTNYYSPFKGEIVYIQSISTKEKLLINQNLNVNLNNNSAIDTSINFLPATSFSKKPTILSNSTDFFSYSCMFLTKNDLNSFYYSKPNQTNKNRITNVLSQTNHINSSFISQTKQLVVTDIESINNQQLNNKYKINDTLIKFLNMTKIQQNSLLKYKNSHISTCNINNQILINISNISAGKPRVMDSPFRSSNKKSYNQQLPLLGDFYTYGDPLIPFTKNLKNNADHIYRIQTTGQIIHYNLLKITIRRGQSIFISPKGILHKVDGDFIDPKAPVITLSYQRLKTGDIIQGIPKVEQFFEARTTKRGRLFRDSLSSLLKALFKRYLSKISFDLAVRQSFYKIQQIIVDGVQRVYKSQGVTISDKHLEIIVKQMTSKVRIVDGAQTGFFTGEVVDLIFIEKINKFLIKKITYEPLVLGITKASLEVDSFLSASSFQQTTRILSQAAIYKKKDFLKGLKENVILGNLIPAGTGFLVFLEDFS